MKLVFLTALFCLSFAVESYTQPAKKKVDFSEFEKSKSRIDDSTVSFTRLIREMEGAEKNIAFSNVRVVFNYSVDKGKNGMDSIFLTGLPKLHFRSVHISFHSCTFDEEFWLVLNGAQFDGHLSFLNCVNLKAIFKNCTFNGMVRFNSNEIDFIKFDSSRFHMGFRANRTTINEQVIFHMCTISSDTAGAGQGFDMPDKVFQAINNLGGDLTLDKCTFYGKESSRDQVLERKDMYRYFIDFSNSRFKDLIIDSCQVNVPILLSKTLVESQFYLYGTAIQSLIMNGASLNSNNTQIEWENISDKISVVDPNHNLITNFNDDYTKGLENDNLFPILVSAYSTLYRTYKDQDNKKYGNKCYVQWKNRERKYQYWKYQNSKNLEDRRSARLEYFLDSIFYHVCDYGTNPVKALEFCFLVIVLFAILFTLLPVRADVLVATDIKSKVLRYVRFVSSGQKQYDDIVIQARVEQSEEGVPSVDKSIVEKKSLMQKILNYDMHLFSQVRHFHSFFDRIYRQYSIRPATRHKKFSFERISYFIVFNFVFLVSLLILFLARFLDCLVLSVNVFTTLGFGELKVKGSAIYFAVLEGFIGWFLLGIFSVSLINQVLT